MKASLLPRKYKIEHEANEYTYFIEWVNGKWAIGFPVDNNFLLKTYGIDRYRENDTAIFDTPEEAFEFWKTYIETVFSCNPR